MRELVATKVTRAFHAGATKLPDPGPRMTPKQVKEFYEKSYPFLVNFVVDGPTFKDGVESYNFVKAVGEKGQT